MLKNLRCECWCSAVNATIGGSRHSSLLKVVYEGEYYRTNTADVVPSCPLRNNCCELLSSR
jgi:hypothetical protein